MVLLTLMQFVYTVLNSTCCLLVSISKHSLSLLAVDYTTVGDWHGIAI